MVGENYLGERCWPGGEHFNFVEGLIDHQILGLHHVLPGHPQQFLFDMLFLFSGLLLVAIGSLMVRSKKGRGRALIHLGIGGI